MNENNLIREQRRAKFLEKLRIYLLNSKEKKSSTVNIFNKNKFSSDQDQNQSDLNTGKIINKIYF